MRELLESTIERLLTDLVTPRLLRSSEAGLWPEELWSVLKTSGLAVAASPESLGGVGAAWSDLYVLARAAGRYSLPVPLPESLLANALLGECGLAAITSPLSVAAGDALALNAGKISGTLRDVPWGRDASHVVAVLPGPTPQLVLLERRLARCTLRLNIAGEPRDDLQFDAVQPEALANLPAGVSADVLQLGGAMLRAAQIAGALQKVLDLTTRYAIERVQFGKPIGAFQAIQHQIAVLSEQVGLATVAAECAFAESGSGVGALALLPIAAAKVCASEACGVAAGIAHTVHGAIGFTHEHALQCSTRRLWSWRSEFGHATHWSQRLGHAICSAGAAGLWPSITSGRLARPALS